jgi:cytochrome c peroxidase
MHVKKLFFGLAIVLCLLAWRQASPLYSSPQPQTPPHRSPIDVIVLPGGQRALSANHTADSVSLIDLNAGKVLAEQPCGHKPAAVACSRDGRWAAVSNLWSDSLTLLEVRNDTLRHTATVAVGHLPRGLVFSPEGDSLYVALSGAHEVVQLNLRTRAVVRRWPAPVEPRRLALTRDGKFLAAASARSAQVRCWDTVSGRLLWERAITDAFNLHGLTLSPDEKELITTHVHDRHHSIARPNIENSWALDSRLGRLSVKPDPDTEYWQIALDLRGRAIGDPCAVAFSARGDRLVVAAAGTHELLLLHAPAIPWGGGEPADFLDGRLAAHEGNFRRLPVGGRPLAVQFIADSSRAVVANYLLDTVQIVEVAGGKLVSTIPLGGPAQPGLARRGESIFYDARRSHHQWFSCNTCHPDGHTSGRTFDTQNDKSYGNPKLTPTLRGVSRTGPWTWHGWQDDLGQTVEKSLTDTLFGPPPSTDDVRALVAFLQTLDHPANPNLRPNGSRTDAAERGKALFEGKARCARCHQGEDYTSSKTYDVKLDGDGSPFDRWNPPSLRGAYDRGPYLHDASAETLEEVLGSFHSPEKLGGAALNPQERRDLIEFLKTL